MIKQILPLNDGKKGQLYYMRNIIDFKDNRISDEWYSGKLNLRLINYILMVALFTWTEFEKRITLTSIFRTKKEERELQSSGIHNCYRGVDIRTSNFTESEIKKIVDFLNKNLHYDARGLHQVAIFGDLKHKNHIHCQVGYRV